MKNTLTAIAIVALAWFVYSRVNQSTELSNSGSLDGDSVAEPSFANPDAESQFTCDGRTHCSQMTSCEEAEYFLQNCPDMKMDGDNDGVPCEGQWCGD